MVAFFTAHPCERAMRRLFTIQLGSRTVIASTVVVSAAPGDSDADIYKYAGQFEQLEKSNCNCGINDLLREGFTIPGGPTRIPANEAFHVLGQDTAVAVFDAWYQSGTTKDQDPALIKLEEDLFFTPLATP